MSTLRKRISLSSTNGRGFTLIELLVIVAILGILAVVMFANLKRALWKAREGRTYEHLQTVRTVVELFHAQKGMEYNYEIDSIAAHHTNGYPYALMQDPTGAVVAPPAGGSDWHGDERDPNWPCVVEKGQFSAYLTTYLTDFPSAEVAKDGKFHIAFDDGFYFLGGVWETNRPTTDAQSNPGDGIANSNDRGFHYRNVDGKVRINNTCVSTDGKQYDLY
ncbi:MAG: type II secretion system protein [Candidatus Hydrogenedentota bacterium]